MTFRTVASDELRRTLLVGQLDITGISSADSVGMGEGNHLLPLGTLPSSMPSRLRIDCFRSWNLSFDTKDIIEGALRRITFIPFHGCSNDL